MKTKFEFGNIKTDNRNKVKSVDFNNWNHPFENMFSKSNLEFINKIYEKASLDLLCYYKDVYKACKVYTKSKKALNENTDGNPNTMPANGHDIYNYVARYGLADFQIQAVLKFDGILNFKRLTKAMMLLIEEQPVFGCRFIECEPPCWRRMDDFDEAIFCSFEQTDHLEETVQKFLETSLDMDKDPMVKAKLIRSGEKDTLCIKINHACCDGTGTKEYIQLLSEIYSTINQKYGIFIPRPNHRGRTDQDRLFRELGISDPEAEWIAGSEITRVTWPFPWKQLQSDRSRMVICRLPQGQLDELKNYSKARGATINDLILTAYYRAMAKMKQPVYEEPMEIPVTIDLRRVLPDHKTEAIRNFSGSEITRIVLGSGESFDETLSRVMAEMNRIKTSRGGLQSAIGLERVEKMTLRDTLAYYKTISQWSCICCDKCAPVLSNLGVIADPLLKFGKKVVTDAYIAPPVVRAPGFLLMVSTYNGIITLAGGFYEGSVLREDIESLLSGIKDELIQGCK